jgi:hypothetical protein
MQLPLRFTWAASLALCLCAQVLSAQSTPVVPLKAPGAAHTAQNLTLRTMGTINAPEVHTFTAAGRVQPATLASPERPGIPDPAFYPGDVSNPGNGPTVESWKAHPVYINNPPSVWGDVAGFLHDLGRSNMVHVIDQYTGAYGDHRYTLGTQYETSGYPITTPGVPTATSQTLLIQDILNLAYAGASLGGTGYGHIYHIFIPPGVDMCLVYPGLNECYSPDNPSTWYFCAFHGSVDFSDIGHVLFSVEPYQNVNGCSVPPGSPNGQLQDSTDNVLSHESFEAISDPDGNAWWVQSGTVLEGEEIGDNCVRSLYYPQFNNYFWDYGVVRLNGHPYNIQPEYSNGVHGCAYGPPNDCPV